MIILQVIGVYLCTSPKYKIVIFVHGCFWHKHGCKRSNIPKTNKEYWVNKIAMNIKKDKESRKVLNLAESRATETVIPLAAPFLCKLNFKLSIAVMR